MSEAKNCPQCGASLSENAVGGLCPQCLLKVGLDSASQIQTADGSNGPLNVNYSVFEPPTVEFLSQAIPQIEFVELIAKGGMGAVYKARQLSLDRWVAVKVLPPDSGKDPAFAERFTREARALGRLNHPNIVSIYDSGVAEGLYYFVMEYIDGVNLRHLMKEDTLTAKESLAIVPQICDALQFAHDEGIVHRDIKPENILIDKKGRVKIADFGLAKLLGYELENENLTYTNQVMGTVKYMAPEQMEGSKDIDHRADIYSLGVVFYEMLTRELPLGRFAPPSARVQIDVRLDEVVMRTLEKQPELRFQHAGDVKTSVENVTHHPAAAVVPPKDSIYAWLSNAACKFDEIEHAYVRWVLVPSVGLVAFCLFVCFITAFGGRPSMWSEGVLISIAASFIGFVFLNAVYLVQRFTSLAPTPSVQEWSTQQISENFERYSRWLILDAILFLFPWLFLVPAHPLFLLLFLICVALGLLTWFGARSLRRNRIPKWYMLIGPMLPIVPGCMLGLPLVIRILRALARGEVKNRFH